MNKYDHPARIRGAKQGIPAEVKRQTWQLRVGLLACRRRRRVVLHAAPQARATHRHTHLVRHHTHRWPPRTRQAARVELTTSRGSGKLGTPEVSGNQNNSEEKEKGGEGGTPRRRRLETGDCACVVPGGRPYAGLGGGARAPREEGPTERRREGPTRRGEEEGPTSPGPGAPPPPPRRRAGRPARPAALPGTRRPCC